MFELSFPALSQTQPAFPPVIAATFCDPALSGHDSESSTKCRTVHDEHFAELALRYLSRERERLIVNWVARRSTGRSAFS
jgi:hypothetical protein